MTARAAPRSAALLIAIGLGAFIAASHLEAAVGAFGGGAPLGLAVAGVGIGAGAWAVQAARRPTRRALLAGAAGAAALLVLWALTRTGSLPLVAVRRAPIGVLDTLTAVDEALLVAFAIAAAGARGVTRECWPVLGSAAISLSFVALAMGCRPPAVAAADRAGGGSTAAFICHVY